MDESLRQLVAEACSYPPGSVKRQRALTRIIRLTSKKLWRESTPHYEDALQQTWVYFCQNICEANTADHPYDPTRGTVSTWLNAYLKRRLQDGYIRDQETRHRAAPAKTLTSDPDHPKNPVEDVAAPPDLPPILETVQLWVERDASGDLCATHIEGHPQVNCQTLILRRMPPEQGWKDLSAEFGLPISTLSSFYQRQCLPRLRKFGESEGYL